MGNYVIYEDENQKVEIEENFHKFLKTQAVEDFILSDDELETVFDYVFKKLSKRKLSMNGINYINNIPVLKSQLYSSFEEPCDVFNDIVHCLEDYMSLDDETCGGTEEIERVLNTMYNKDNIYCGIFPRKIFNVKGFLLYKSAEDNDWLMLFDFKDFNSNLLDFLV